MDIAKRLRRKFILVSMASVTAVLILIVGSINIVNHLGVIERANERLDLIEREGDTLAQEAAERTPQANPPTHDVSAETPFDMRFFTVTLDAAGNVTSTNMSNIAAITEQQAEQMAIELWQAEATQGFTSVYRYRVISLDGEGTVRGSTETPGGDEAPTSGRRYTYMFLDCSRELRQSSSFLKASIAISGLGLVLVFALIAALSHAAIKPIVESYDKQRRFITDASHELKTPLAIIDANTEVIELYEGESEWTRGIHEQISRMATLTERLVFLARMDEGDELEAAECDLSDLAARTVEPYHAVALASNKRISANIEANVRCRGNGPALAQAMCLLLDNAMRYASEDSVIEVSVRSQGHLCRIDVTNTCDDLPTGDLEALFERFYRSDGSRTRDTGGSGIGLSVVKAIAEAHHGQATCSTSHGDTITFTLSVRS